jgi:ketosteroid isomerase-like protein
MRNFVVASALAIVVASLAGCSGSDVDAAAAAVAQQQSDYWQIDQIEKSFHEATTMKDIDLMMTLWAPDATATVTPGDTSVGFYQIRQLWEGSTAFSPDTKWVSDHPAYKLEITANGDRGTLHFECHYLDYGTHEVAFTTVADLDVARIDGRWLITNFVGASTQLEP